MSVHYSWEGSRWIDEVTRRLILILTRLHKKAIISTTRADRHALRANLAGQESFHYVVISNNDGITTSQSGFNALGVSRTFEEDPAPGTRKFSNDNFERGSDYG